MDTREDAANRYRKSKDFEPGDKVLYRDPRVKAVGGRSPWKEPLSDPAVVETVRGNKYALRRADGSTVEAHAEDLLRVPTDARNYEREELVFDPEDEERGEDRLDARRSIGEMLRKTGGHSRLDADAATYRKRYGEGKLEKLTAGEHIVYSQTFRNVRNQHQKSLSQKKLKKKKMSFLRVKKSFKKGLILTP